MVTLRATVTLITPIPHTKANLTTPNCTPTTTTTTRIRVQHSSITVIASTHRIPPTPHTAMNSYPSYYEMCSGGSGSQTHTYGSMSVSLVRLNPARLCLTLSPATPPSQRVLSYRSPRSNSNSSSNSSSSSSDQNHYNPPPRRQNQNHHPNPHQYQYQYHPQHHHSQGQGPGNSPNLGHNHNNQRGYNNNNINNRGIGNGNGNANGPPDYMNYRRGLCPALSRDYSGNGNGNGNGNGHGHNGRRYMSDHLNNASSSMNGLINSGHHQRNYNDRNLNNHFGNSDQGGPDHRDRAEGSSYNFMRNGGGSGGGYGRNGSHYQHMAYGNNNGASTSSGGPGLMGELPSGSGLSGSSLSLNNGPNGPLNSDSPSRKRRRISGRPQNGPQTQQRCLMAHVSLKTK
ncbi:hypothetical protein M5D96_001989 [Drosophila gunungcola]|uniref:Uncharacterized protein n=1 Tax=Drosophila gunungcola TaxID=103775 RepID=A0A9Q0BVV2_9MUSC|nr:hypothetical protein M5D96_001989 [Drosophila gunungcola]